MNLIDAVILSVTLLDNGDLIVIERPAQIGVPAVFCPAGCDFTPPPIKLIYRAKDGKIALLKEVHQVPVEKTESHFVMEFPE